MAESVENKNTRLILGLDGEVIQINNFSELIERLFGNEYSQLTAKEQLNHRYDVALPRAVMSGKKIVISNKGVLNDKLEVVSTDVDLDNSILIDNDVTLVVGLAGINFIQLFEKMDANIFGKFVDKSKIGQARYLNIGANSKEIIENYLKTRDEKGER